MTARAVSDLYAEVETARTMTVLCYHSVQPDWSSPLATDPAGFAAHCEWLSKRKRVLPLSEAAGRLDGSGRLPRGMTALTFDDGFEALYDHAMAPLRRNGLPATVFLVAQTPRPPGSRGLGGHPS